MNAATKKVSLAPGVSVELARINYGAKLAMNSMIVKFLPELPPEGQVDPDTMNSWTAGYTLIQFGAYTRSMKGIELTFASPTDDQDVFEQKVQALLEQDDVIVEAWSEAITKLTTPDVPKHQMEKEALTRREKADPN